MDGFEHRINCTECPARVECRSSTRKQAIAAWNRRAAEAPAPAAEAASIDVKALVMDHAALEGSALMGMMEENVKVSDFRKALSDFAEAIAKGARLAAGAAPEDAWQMTPSQMQSIIRQTGLVTNRDAWTIAEAVIAAISAPVMPSPAPLAQPTDITKGAS